VQTDRKPVRSIASARRSRRNSPSTQSGQALLLGIGLLALCVGAWLLMLKVGSWVHNKSSLHRATDAAAYSAALIYARNLNLHAYLNRTQLAHQVAQLHLFSMAAAERFRSRLARQATARNPPASLLSFRFGTHHGGAYLSSRGGGLSDTLLRNALGNAFEQHEQLIHAVLNQVRESRMDTSSEIHQVLNNTLVMNLGHSGSANRGSSLEALGVQYRLLNDGTTKFMVNRPTTDDEWFGMLQDVRARYRYLDDRKSVARSFNGINLRCPWRQHQLRRRGTLTLARDGVWSIDENQSFHNVRFNRFIGCYYREYPMGWATIETRSNGSHVEGSLDEPMQTFQGKPFWKWAAERAWSGWNIFGGTRNPLAERWANQAPVVWRARQQARYTRLNPARDSASAQFVIQVVQRWLDYPSLSSTSAAETYFSDPLVGKNRRAEAPSLFKPFWLARLIRVPAVRSLESHPVRGTQ
jgi:hypothetical protein